MRGSLPLVLAAILGLPAGPRLGIEEPARARQDPGREEALFGRWERSGERVGSETCAACHPDIAAAQAVHPMARTAASLTPETVETWFPATRLRTEISWRSAAAGETARPRYARTGSGVALAAPDGQSAAVHAVFGSGLRGVTPVAFEADGRMRELRVSWSQGLGAWIETPGSEGDTHPLGDLDSPRQMRECVSCHATAVAWNGPAPDPERTEWGIRCERCHGPGGAHAGTADPGLIFNPGRLEAAAQVSFCGQCHRKPTDFEPLQVLTRDRALARHAGGSLMMSACFLETPAAGAVSCTDCHNPHRAEASVAATSRAVCRRCHQDPAALHDYERVTAASDCLGCHMPRLEEVFRGAAFTDHRIRVHGSAPRPGSAAERVELATLEAFYRNELAEDHDPREEARLLIGLGELLFAQGLRATAVETLGRGLEADPDYERLLKAAALLRENGRYPTADAALERAAAMEPGAAQAFFDLGDLRLALDDAKGAVIALQAANRLDSTSGIVLSRLGSAYRKAGRLEEALEAGLAAVEAEAESPEPWLELGLTRWRRRELGNADEALRAAYRLDSDTPAILDPLARLLALDPDPEVRDLLEAQRLAERLAGFGRYQEPRSLDLLAAVHAAAGDFELAVRTAERALLRARTLGARALATEIQARLTLYRSGRSWTSPDPGRQPYR